MFTCVPGVYVTRLEVPVVAGVVVGVAAHLVVVEGLDVTRYSLQFAK